MKKIIALFFIIAGVSSVPAHAADLSYEVLTRARLKLDNWIKVDDFGECYMQAFQGPVWQRYHDNEFEFPAKLEAAQQRLKAWVAEYDPKDLILVRQIAIVGKYDTTKQAFAFQPFGPTTYFRPNGAGFAVQSNCGDVFGSHSLRLTNTELLSHLPLPPDQARAFVEGHRERKTHLYIYVEPIKAARHNIDAVIRKAEVRSAQTNALLYTFETSPHASFAGDSGFELAGLRVGMPWDQVLPVIEPKGFTLEDPSQKTVSGSEAIYGLLTQMSDAAHGRNAKKPDVQIPSSYRAKDNNGRDISIKFDPTHHDIQEIQLAYNPAIEHNNASVQSIADDYIKRYGKPERIDPEPDGDVWLRWYKLGERMNVVIRQDPKKPTAYWIHHTLLRSVPR